MKKHGIMPYDVIAPKATIEKTIAALKARNIEAELVPTKNAALARIKELIPAGASVMTGSSATLNQIGFTDYLKSAAHPWKNIKATIANEKDAALQAKLRRESILSEYFLGSVHAVTEDGEILVASASGSQLPSYAFSSQNVIWVAGAQKITPDLDGAMERLTDYVFPLEDARMKSTGAAGSSINKLLIFKREPPYLGRTIRLIFVNEKLGF